MLEDSASIGGVKTAFTMEVPDEGAIKNEVIEQVKPVPEEVRPASEGSGKQCGRNSDPGYR